MFILDENHDKAVKSYYKKHLTKIPLELSQVLSTAHNEIDGKKDGLYKSTHINHPLCIFARKSVNNYLFVLHHLEELFKEFRYRREKIHGCEKILPIISKVPINLTEYNEMIILPNCTPYNNINSIEAYRKYYMVDKRHLADFEMREKPNWWK